MKNFNVIARSNTDILEHHYDRMKGFRRDINCTVHIKIENLSKKYDEHQVKALSDLSLNIERGEFVAIMGPSGCGKSTLLNLIAGIDKPSSGRLFIADTDIAQLNDHELTAMRRQKIGFVFQFFNLLSTLTAYENISLPLELSGSYSNQQIKNKCNEILEKVGLSKRGDFYPSQMSGGEMQRVAIARAIIHGPELIVADEPTGNLDTENGEQILSLFRELCRQGQHTAIMATHSADAAASADKIVRLKDGRLLETIKN